MPPDRRLVAELVRLPAVLSVPGDTLLGAAAAGASMTPLHVLGRAAASSCLYLGGMALNDYADREVDAVERPQRPIPSGRVDPTFALRLAQGLTVGGVALAGAVGGRRALQVAVPLAATVWAYDLKLKGGLAGPVAMAGARSLDVMMGASSGNRRAALVPAAVVGGHILTITLVSRHEAQGGTPQVGRDALLRTAAVVAGAALFVSRATRRSGSGRRTWMRTAAAAGLLAAFTSALGRAEIDAIDDPSAGRLQQVVGTGVLGLMPLEAAMLSSVGPLAASAAVAAAWPLARRASRRRPVT